MFFFFQHETFSKERCNPKLNPKMKLQKSRLNSKHSSTSLWKNIKHKQECHSSTFKAKENKVGFFKTLEEIVDKFIWDQFIIDPQLNFAPRTRGYHPWIKIKSKLNTFFKKLVEEYQTQYESLIHPFLRLKKIKTNSKDFFCSPKCLRKVFTSLVENKSSLTLN